MIKIEKDKVIGFKFEVRDHTAQNQFEECFLHKNSVEMLMKSLVRALSEASREERNAWRQMRDTIQAEFKIDTTDLVLRYNFIEGLIELDVPKNWSDLSKKEEEKMRMHVEEQSSKP